MNFGRQHTGTIVGEKEKEGQLCGWQSHWLDACTILDRYLQVSKMFKGGCLRCFNTGIECNREEKAGLTSKCVQSETAKITQERS